MNSEYLTPKYPRRKRHGKCPFCQRDVDLTFHHLIPKKMHRRTFFKKNFKKYELARGIDICRACHDGIHRTYSEMELAKSFTCFDSLNSDPQLSLHFQWVAKQKIKKPNT